MEWCSGGEGVIFLIFVVFHFSVALSSVNSTTTKTSTATAAPPVRDPREYCATEEFRPRCLPDQETIVMTEAGYGRMSIGECVKQDYGYLGCTAEVLDQMDEYCSGRRTCSVRIPDSRLEEVNTCPKEFKAYLNASYECVEVDQSPCLGCHPPTRSSLARITRSRGFIGSVVTLESPAGLCGSAHCPWYIEVQSGQTINLTLYDFSGRHASPSSSSSSSSSTGGTGGQQCTRLAVIKEATHVKETPVCYGRNRIQPVYSSVSQSIQIHVVSKEVLKAKGHFLIQYEVIGCPDLQSPENARLKRMGDRMIVECRDSSLRWESQCVDSKWEGEIGTCPGSSLQTTSPPSFLTLPLGVLVAIVMGIALVIGVLIVTVGVVCIKRQQTDMFSRTGNVLYVPAAQCYELRGDDRPPIGRHPSGSGRKTTSGRTSQQSYGAGGSFKGPPPPHLLPGRRNVYAHARMESRPLPSLPNLDEGDQGAPGGGGGGRVVVHAVELGPCPCHLHAAAVASSSSSSSGRTKGKKSSGKRREEGRGRGYGANPMHPHIIPVAAASCCGGGGGGGGGVGVGPGPSFFPPQHYTVLDPIEVQHQLTGSLRGPGRSGPTAAAASASSPSTAGEQGPPPMPPPPSVTVVCQGPAAGAGAAGGARCGGEGGIEKSSCREITLRPTRQNSARAKTDDNVVPNSGNCSWP